MLSFMYKLAVAQDVVQVSLANTLNPKLLQMVSTLLGSLLPLVCDCVHELANKWQKLKKIHINILIMTFPSPNK